MTISRREELAENLAAIREEITAACVAAQRSPSDVTLIAVTKTYPASDVDLLAELGVTDVGENRHPEAERTKADVTADVRWHFIGGLQTNKAAAIARYADVVHSVDRPKLVTALQKGALAAERHLDCLIQVDFDATDPGRAGVVPDGVLDLAENIAQAENLNLSGVMVVAPLGVDPEPVFARLATISEELKHEHPEATMISAGMSEDFALAIKYGATHVRIGRSILGNR